MSNRLNKIAIVIANPDFSFLNKNSAVANFLILIGDLLVQSGFEVDYFPKKSYVQSGKSLKIPAKQFIKKAIKSVFPSLVFNKKFKNYFRRVEILNNEISEKVKDFDLIIEFCVYGSKVGFIAKKKYNRKYVLIFDAPLDVQFEEMYRQTGKFKSNLLNAEKASIENAEVVICYSDAVKNYLSDFIPKLPKTEIIPCIAWKNPTLQKVNSEKISIGFIGSFLNWHKVELLVKAFENIAVNYPQISLILVGYGEEWNNIESLVNKSLVSKRILLTGFVEDVRLEKIKSEMSIGVMPGSNWYGSPLKLFEYAESGIPIIAPETPTVLQYFKHHENALIIDSKNELNSLVNNLELLINQPELRIKLGVAGLKMMQNDLSKENVMTKFVQLVKKNIA